MNRPHALLTSAAASRKNDLESLLARAQSCRASRRFDEAKALYGKILRKHPDHVGAMHLLACCEHESGDSEAGARLLKRALQLDPRSAAMHTDLGTLLATVRRTEEALACYDKALVLQPGFGDAHFNRGMALQTLERSEEAVESFDRALSLNPRRTAALSAKGYALHALGRIEDAVASYDRALALNPQLADALVNRGAALLTLGRIEQALADLDRAAELTSSHAGLWVNRAKALAPLGRYSEALESYQKALSIEPKLVDAWLGMGVLLLEVNKDVTGARACCERALALQPDSIAALVLTGECHFMEGDPDSAVASCDRALAVTPDFEPALSFKVMYLDYSAHTDTASQLKAREDWWRQIGARLFEESRAPHDNDRRPDRKIVLGYVSGDFNNRSPAYSFRPVLENHDRQQFEVICYSTSPRNDPITESFRSIANLWRDAWTMGEDRLAECIRADKVDILIDLSGHTAQNRLRTFARKPAPVQVTAWGFGTGSGLRSIDYMFCDPVALPHSDRPLYAEKIYDLPSLMIMEPPPAELRSLRPPALVNGYKTYGLLNRTSKFSGAAISVWAQILQADPTARLLIKDPSLENDPTRSMLLEKFGAHGIAAERMILMGKSSRGEHMLAYGQVDICLDPFPQNGGISTWEALYMGVPVVAKLGTTIASRCGGAIVSAIGMADWVASDDAQYAEIARAATPEMLAHLREALPSMIAERCGPAAYTRAVEDAYRTMWTTYCASSDPAP